MCYNYVSSLLTCSICHDETGFRHHHHVYCNDAIVRGHRPCYAFQQKWIKIPGSNDQVVSMCAACRDKRDSAGKTNPNLEQEYISALSAKKQVVRYRRGQSNKLIKASSNRIPGRMTVSYQHARALSDDRKRGINGKVKDDITGARCKTTMTCEGRVSKRPDKIHRSRKVSRMQQMEKEAKRDFLEAWCEEYYWKYIWSPMDIDDEKYSGRQLYDALMELDTPQQQQLQQSSSSTNKSNKNSWQSHKKKYNKQGNKPINTQFNRIFHQIFNKALNKPFNKIQQKKAIFKLQQRRRQNWRGRK